MTTIEDTPAIEETPPSESVIIHGYYYQALAGDDSARVKLIESCAGMIARRVDAFIRTCKRAKLFRAELIQEGFLLVTKIVNQWCDGFLQPDHNPAGYLSAAIKDNCLPSYRGQSLFPRSTALQKLKRSPLEGLELEQPGSSFPTLEQWFKALLLRESLLGCCRSATERDVFERILDRDSRLKLSESLRDIAQALGLAVRTVQNIRKTVIQRAQEQGVLLTSARGKITFNPNLTTVGTPARKTARK